MSQGKTEFKIFINGDVAIANTIIHSWLAVNQFVYQPRQGANYFAFNDPLVKGKRGFEYYINGNQVTILAYLGTYEKPQELEGVAAAVLKQNYRNELAPLFQELNKIGQTPQVHVPPAYQSPTFNGTAPNQANSVSYNSLNTFAEQNNKRQETFVIVGFVLSIIGILLMCLGVTFGAIIIFFEYYFAIQGLKTRKKGLAIATIVFASIAAVMTVVNLVLNILMM